MHAQGAYADDRLPCVACRVLVQSMGNMAWAGQQEPHAAKLTRDGRLAALQLYNPINHIRTHSHF